MCKAWSSFVNMVWKKEVQAMEQSLFQSCVEFITYRDICRQDFLWTAYRQVFPVCAYIYMNHRTEPNSEMTKLCKEILRENNGLFSAFRSNGEPIFVSMLATEEDPGMKMDAAQVAYTHLRNYFMASAYLPFLAMVMPDMMPVNQFDRFASETRQLYDEMNRQHTFLTGSEDVIFAGLLCVNRERDYRELVDEMEYLYANLKDTGVFHRNAMQSLSHALVLCQGSAQKKYNNLQELCYMLKSSGIKYGKDYEMIPLGILANVGIDLETVCNDLIEVYDFLEKENGYGFFGFGKTARLMHASMILCAYYSPGIIELSSAVIISVLLEIQQQQAAQAAAAA